MIEAIRTMKNTLKIHQNNQRTTSNPQVIYKTKRPYQDDDDAFTEGEKMSYYRLTNYIEEPFAVMDNESAQDAIINLPKLIGLERDKQELRTWYDTLKSRNIPCCLASGDTPGYEDKYAIWVWGREYGEIEKMLNTEKIGRVIESFLWPAIE